MPSVDVFPLQVWTSQITQASIPANNNSLRVEVLMAPAQEITSSGPSSPPENSVYIVGANPSGTFSTFSKDDVVIFKSGTYIGFKPFTGWVKSVFNVVYYYDGLAWSQLQSGGGGGGSDPWTYLKLPSDFVLTGTSFVNMLSFPSIANQLYLIEAFGAYSVTEVAQAPTFKMGGPLGSTTYLGKQDHFTSGTTTAGVFQNNTTGPVNNANSAVANAIIPIELKFLVRPNANATLSLQMRTRNSTTNVTVPSANFYLRYRII